MNAILSTAASSLPAAQIPAAVPAIGIAEATDPAVWNDYVARHSARSILHRAEWEHVFATYGLPVVRLAAERNGKIVGVLPLVWQKSMLFGNQLVSLPWFDAAGVLADDAAVCDRLIAAGRTLASARGNATLQLRQTEPSELNCPVRTDKVLMKLSLPGDPDVLWRGLSAKVRNQVRKGQKSELTIERGHRELVGDFYGVYSRNMRDLGSPSHHLRFFERVIESFPESCRIYVVRYAGRAVGAGFTIGNGCHLEIPWASSLRDFNRLCVNHFMYWEILADACRDGFSGFHFGRSSRDSGTYNFKRQWGAEEVQLYWYLLSDRCGRRSEAPQPQETYGWAARIWQRLPLRLARALGPRLIAKIP